MKYNSSQVQNTKTVRESVDQIACKNEIDRLRHIICPKHEKKTSPLLEAQNVHLNIHCSSLMSAKLVFVPQYVLPQMSLCGDGMSTKVFTCAHNYSDFYRFVCIFVTL